MSRTNLASSRFAWRRIFIFATLASSLCPVACVERNETIQVQPDGRVNFTLVHRSDSESDLYEGDAVPSLRGGWIISEAVEEGPDGREAYSFTAEATYAPGKRLPANLADLGDPDAELAMQFPTTLTIEKRGRQTYYHFARVYEPRAWEQVEFQRRAMDKELEAVKDKPVGEWSVADRERVVQAYLQHDFAKRLWFARQAYIEVMPDKRQDGWLAVQAALRDLLHDQDVSRLSTLLLADLEKAQREDSDKPGGEHEQQPALEAAGERIEREANETMQAALRASAAFSGEQVNAFLSQYQRARQFHSVTEDLGDDTFQITVEMPGTIVSSNAPSASDHQAVWNLRGEDVRDRRIELLVSSVIDR